MKYGQLTECNVRIIFLKNTQNVLEKLFPDLFPNDQN